jgi:ParB family transcriptional regulator, chromosome partitioning protein
MTADKAAAVEQAGQDKGARPALRRALGRGLESLLRPASASTSGATIGPTGAMAPAAVAAGATATAVVSGPQAIPEGATGHGDGGVAPGVIAELQAQAAPRKADGHEVLDLAVNLVDLNPHQTRSWTKWEIEALDELRDSIRVQGVLQPITVRPGKGGRYTLITGERRLRASEMAGKTTIPAIVRTVSEQQAAEMTVIENLQRRDLNCVDLARAYIVLSKDFNLTQEQIGQRVGVARETVSNYMRLAKLPQDVQRYLQNGDLEFSHARILLNLDDPAVIEKVAIKAVDEDWSVDKLEHFVLFDPSMHGVKRNVPKAAGKARWVDPNVRAAQRDLERILGVRVRIRDRNGKGKITLEYSTLEDFDRVLGMLKGKS